MANQQTTKKVKIVGTQEYINSQTGEIVEMQVSQIEERDFNFSKVWMRNFIAALDIVGNKKTKLCYWVIDNINKDNMLIKTLRSISEETGISLETVRVTMNRLMEADFLRRKSPGLYIVNPNIVFKGARGSRLNVLNQYNASEKAVISDEEMLKNILATIASLQDKANKLSNRIEEKRQNEASNQATIEDYLEEVG